jgi:uncharacterized protein with PhoU and TrkA domain
MNQNVNVWRHVVELEKNVDTLTARVRELESAARQKLAEKSDEQAVDEIIATAWYT